MSLEYSTTTRDGMRPRDWFEVGVRIVGVWQLTLAFDQAVAFANVQLQLVTTSSQGYSFLTHGLAYAVVGLFLFMTAKSVVNCVYPDRRAVTSAEGESQA